MKRVGAIIAKPITPIWIGGYNATAYSPELGILEPIRPTEIKGILRWMLRNLAFAAVYESIGGDIHDRIAKARYAALKFVKRVLSSASSEGGGGMSAYVIRIEEPEGGFLDKDTLEIREKNLYVEKWVERQQEILEKYLDKVHHRSFKGKTGLGVYIYACPEESESRKRDDFSRATLIPLPYLDIAEDTIDPEGDREKDVKGFLRNLAYEMNEGKKNLIERAIINKYKLIKVITRYRLEPMDERCAKILSIGDPRTQLASLGEREDRRARAAKIFLVPPSAIDVIRIVIYRRREPYKVAKDVEKLDEIILRSLRLALILKGLGKATTRGYGSFEAYIEGRSDELKDLDSIREEIEDLKQKILEMMELTEPKTSDMKSESRYIAFIDKKYSLYQLYPVDSSYNRGEIHEKLGLIGYSTLKSSIIKITTKNDRSIIDKCLHVLGTPRGKNKKRRISYIWFRILKSSVGNYLLTILAFKPIPFDQKSSKEGACVDLMIEFIKSVIKFDSTNQ